MRADGSLLVTLAVHFGILSLLAIGGGNTAVPEMHRQAVEVAHWMSDRQFADLFAIAQAAPGPNALIVTLIGYHVAGFAGAVVATLAMCGPSCVFAYFVGHAWERFKAARWRIVLQAALVPVSVGLIASTAFILVRTTDHSWVAVAITVATALVAYSRRFHPLWMFGLGSLLGLAGLV